VPGCAESARAVSSAEEQPAYNRQVTGSSPVPPTERLAREAGQSAFSPVIRLGCRVPQCPGQVRCSGAGCPATRGGGEVIGLGHGSHGCIQPAASAAAEGRPGARPGGASGARRPPGRSWPLLPGLRPPAGQRSEVQPAPGVVCAGHVCLRDLLLGCTRGSISSPAARLRL
jgi:hypothetical protein